MSKNSRRGGMSFLQRTLGLTFVLGFAALIYFRGTDGTIVPFMKFLTSWGEKGVEQIDQAHGDDVLNTIINGSGDQVPQQVSEAQKKLAELAANTSLPDSMQGYNRKSFPHWENAHKNGWTEGNDKCSTRQAALIRDGEGVEFDDKCRITKGKWYDPYGTGDPANPEFKETTNPKDMDSDHIVALGEAWRTGAKTWDAARREQFANDPDNIMVSGAATNRSKGDQSAASWLPMKSTNPHGKRCEYVERYITVKHKYGLSVTNAEADQLRMALDECGGGQPAPNPAPAPAQ
jgi:hypothetical protein